MLADELGQAFRRRMEQQRLHPSAGTQVEHYVEISEVRPFSAKDFESFFSAMCECGWVGEAKPTEVDARAEAKSHTWHIKEEVSRPLA